MPQAKVARLGASGEVFFGEREAGFCPGLIKGKSLIAQAFSPPDQ